MTFLCQFYIKKGETDLMQFSGGHIGRHLEILKVLNYGVEMTTQYLLNN